MHHILPRGLRAERQDCVTALHSDPDPLPSPLLTLCVSGPRKTCRRTCDLGGQDLDLPPRSLSSASIRDTQVRPGQRHLEPGGVHLTSFSTASPSLLVWNSRPVTPGDTRAIQVTRANCIPSSLVGRPLSAGPWPWMSPWLRSRCSLGCVTAFAPRVA